MQYPLLLKRAFEAGINGKTWRLLRSRYMKPKCRVKVNGRLSWWAERGTSGLRLSPTLFLLVIDPLLKKLEADTLGPKIDDHAGAFAHADDVRTVAVKPPSAPVCTISGNEILPSDSAKCLGHGYFLWKIHHRSDQESTGCLLLVWCYWCIPRQSQSSLRIESCVMPVLLYNCENWLLTKYALLDKLERFQAELGRRILPSTRSMLFAWPLTFLQWLRGSWLGNWSSYAGCHQIRARLSSSSRYVYHNLERLRSKCH